MADKRRIRYNIRFLNHLATWKLLLLLLLVGFVAATFLRLNNVGMIERRTAVLAADKAGDSLQIQERLYDLQRYTAAHMNANSGPFYLEHQYKRDTEAIIKSVSGSENPNGNIYAKADAVCKPRYGTVYSNAYQECFLGELAKYPAANGSSGDVTLPDPSMYRHDFRAPLWSADFAGLAVLLGGIILVAIVTRLFMLTLLHAMLRRRYRDI